jgi:hypothetical protein
VPEWRARAIVHAKDLVAGEFLEQALVKHGESPAHALFAGLEDEVDSAVEAAHLGEVARGAQEHGGVTVVAARMHDAVLTALVANAGRFQYRQCVHVGPEANAL